jgi:hypothetical protein
MPQRVRSRSTTVDGGIRWQSGAPIASVPITNVSESFTDFNDPGDCRPISGASWKFFGGIIEHPLDTAGTGFQTYVCDMLRSTVAGPHIGNPDGIPSDTAAATMGAARTNPSRPLVDLPIELGQIGELFHLVKDAGQQWLSTLGRANLGLQFGTGPVLNDLKKIFQFHDAVDRRIKEVDRLKTNKGLRRTVEVGMGSLASDVLWTQQSNGIFLSTRARGNTIRTKRVHCRWSPTVDFSKVYTPDSMRRLIQRAVLGLTLDLSTVWELIPWTWLIDWGFNVGTFLSASRNIIPASLTTCVVMTHTQTEWSAPGLSGIKNGKPYSLSPIQIQRDGKTRTTVSPAVTAQFPFLNGNQVGILASLAVTKAKGPLLL